MGLTAVDMGGASQPGNLAVLERHIEALHAFASDLDARLYQVLEQRPPTPPTPSTAANAPVSDRPSIESLNARMAYALDHLRDTLGRVNL